ncbi:hypothetical protein [Pseudoduganella sp. R-43]|uniref:hypothetical protein n=1 Tax=unclassified Pseudoduganella TaxID=2637179 RepID=UPI003CF74536
MTQIALQDYSDDDDFYGQGFQRQNKVSVWVGLDGSRGEPELDVLQDLCGVGYYRLSDQEHYNFDFAAVDLRDLIAPLSYSATFIGAAIATARKRGLEKARWVTVQYDFEYDPLKVTRQISSDPIFVGSFFYTADSVESLTHIRQDGNRIEEGMGVGALLEKGWEPQPVVRIEWKSNGHFYGLDFPDGVLAIVLPGRSRIASFEPAVQGGPLRNRLVVRSAQGEQLYVIDGRLPFEGIPPNGKFVWFEPSPQQPEQWFGAVLEANGRDGMEQFLLSFEIETGELRSVQPLQR